MQMFLIAVLLAAGAVPSVADETNPLAKVIELMDDFYAKVANEGAEADKAYTEYVNWCDDAAFDFRAEIKTATAKKGKLEAAIDELTAEISECDANIEKLVKALATADKDLKDATLIREKEAKEFATAEAELMDTIDTLKRAISIISKEMAKNPAFAQVDTSNFQAVVQALSAIVDGASFSAAGKQKLIALVQANQESEEAQEPGAPAAAVYKSHSGELVEMLEDLLEKAEEDLAALRKAEMNAKQNYEMLKQSLEDTLKNGDKDKADEEAKKKSASEEKATNEKDLAITTKGLDASNEALAECKQSCMTVASDHEASVAARNEELKVIEEAKKILQESTSGAVGETYGFLQLKLQSRADLKKAEVLSMVKSLAKQYHSSSLAQLASRIEAAVKLGSAGGADPFEKVKGMISDLIAKLEKEASDAAEEKAYCDDQIAKTEEKKSELEEDLGKLTAKMDKDAATSASLKGDVKQLQEELAALAKLQSEMDKLRTDNNEAYKKSKALMEKGLDGVRKALSILKDYYQGASLLQSGGSLEAAMAQPAPPAMHSKGMGAGGGIIGILEVCESDFAKQLASIEQEESDELAEYEKTTQENAVMKTKKEQAVKYKTQEFKSLDKALADMAADKETMSTELKAVLEYYAKIKDRCIAKPEGYEERKRRREAEIAGLKEALSILESETALVEVRSRHRRGRHFTLKA